MHLKTLVRAKGLEPSTSTLARLRSSQLSYARTAWCILTYLFSNCKCYFIDNFYGLDMLILMKNIPDKNLGSARKSRELLMAGSYNTLFDNLVFNPPARFFVYAAPDSVHDIFHRTFDALNNAATSINRHDAWAFDDVARITWDWVRAKPVKHAWESAQKNLTNEMRRAGATRLVDGRAVTQTLIHQSDAVLDMDWRPLYDAHTAIQKHMFETTHEFSPKINDRVRAMLAQWHDGNRHNLLNMGIIPMMHHAGWTDNQIRAALISDGGNPWLNRTIEKYINNIRGR